MTHSLGRVAIFFAVGAMAAAAPAQAQEVFAGIVPASFSKRWSPNEWHVWAMPDGSCLALSQEPESTPFRFWGFRQSPGSRIDLIFGGFDNLRPRTVQMSFNDGGKFDYEARVVHYSEWDAYAISIQGNALSIFHEQTIVESFVNGQKIFFGITNSMRNVEKAMRKCLEWQASQ